jgi:multiple sugar transport system substrate-binding protein
VQRLKRWWTKGLLFEGSSYTPPLWGAMREGILWSTTDPSWWLLGMRDNITKPEDHVGDWRVAPMPVFQAGGSRTANFGGAGLTAPAHTKNPELVKAFVKYATTQQNATVATVKMGTLVAHKSAFTDSAVLDLTLEPTGPQKIYRVYAELSKEVPATFYYSPGWPEIYDIVNQNLLTLVKSDTPVEVGMKKMADDARKANERWVKLLDQ